MRKFLPFVFILICLISSTKPLSAQEKTITGKVLGEENLALLSKGGVVSEARPASTEAPATPVKKEFKPLKLGAKGDSVKKVQELLGIKADGDFGAGTEKAVKSFQKKFGIPVTGIVDAKTLKALRGK
jgi:peptidoglycan hydrolase-like protein with peptidoglycan-binding domain